MQFILQFRSRSLPGGLQFGGYSIRHFGGQGGIAADHFGRVLEAPAHAGRDFLQGGVGPEEPRRGSSPGIVEAKFRPELESVPPLADRT